MLGLENFPNRFPKWANCWNVPVRSAVSQWADGRQLESVVRCRDSLLLCHLYIKWCQGHTVYVLTQRIAPFSFLGDASHSVDNHTLIAVYFYLLTLQLTMWKLNPPLLAI